MTLTLGRQSEPEVQQKPANEAEPDRFTRLDRQLMSEVNAESLIDLRPEVDRSALAHSNHHLLVGRLKNLERMGLAREEETGIWSLSAGMERTLRDLGEQGDIIKTMHRALT